MRKLIFSIILIFPFLYGKVLHPQGNVVGEFLDIQGKVREYYLLDNDSYNVSGPSVVTVYARLAVPKNEKGSQIFSINTFISEVSTLESIHEFEKKVDASVSSIFHPQHRYTKSAKVEIEIPKGEFVLLINNGSIIGKPILTRVIQRRLKN